MTYVIFASARENDTTEQSRAEQSREAGLGFILFQVPRGGLAGEKNPKNKNLPNTEREG